LIPLHNLTSEAYRIRGGEGLIWIEFTKTAPEIVRRANPPYARRGTFHPIEASKTDRSIDYYFQRANDGRPIRSSIPEAVKDAATKAQEAAMSAAQAAQSARSAGRLYGGISIAAALAVILALVIGLHQYFGLIQANVQTTQALASTITMNADQARSDAARAMTDEQALRRDLETTKAQLDDIRGQFGVVTSELERLRQQPTKPTTRSRR
jgi:hypothetical protein